MPIPMTTATERRMERIYGKPMPQILADTLNQCGTIKATAQALEISEPTCHRWLRRWGIEIRTVATAPTP